MKEENSKKFLSLMDERDKRRQELIRERVGPFWDCLLWHKVSLQYDGPHGLSRVRIESNGFGFLELEEMFKSVELKHINLVSEKGKPVLYVTVFDPDEDFKGDWDMQKIYMGLKEDQVDKE